MMDIKVAIFEDSKILRESSLLLRLKYVFLCLTMLLCFAKAYPQNHWIDSVKKSLATQKEDTNKVLTLLNLSAYYQQNYPDSDLVYAQQALNLAKALNYDQGIFWADVAMDGALIFTGNYPLELECTFNAFTLAKKINMPRTSAYANGMLGDYYYNLGDYAASLSYWREAIKIAEKWFPDEKYAIWANFSKVYDGMDEHDSAMLYAMKTYIYVRTSRQANSNDSAGLISLTSTLLGNAFLGKVNYDSALFYYRSAIRTSLNLLLQTNLLDCYNGIASVYKATGKLDSAIWYADHVLTSRIANTYPVSLLKAASIMSAAYELKNKPDSALKYLHKAFAIKDSLFSREKMIAIQDLTYKEQEKQQQINTAKTKLRNQYTLYFLLGSVGLLLVVSGIILKNRRQRQLQKIRNSIADDLHDDIGSALSSISIMNELAKASSPEALPLLTSIGENTIAIQENMSDIIWAVNAQNDRFENISQRMNQFASEILDTKNTTLHFTCDASLAAIKLTMEQRKNFYLFFKEVINNAAKYAEAKQVVVCITKKDNHIEMNILDDGKGFDTSATYNGNGMRTLKKRAAELAAGFTIAPGADNGAAVWLKFKIS